jgi:late competence protein required for DNA uptake (superfamily II DNA/RNA helicase)
MNTKKIFDENGQGFTRIFASDKVEKVNPVEYYKTYELEKRAISTRDLLNAKNITSLFFGIKFKDCNILVSAVAGSGKTTSIVQSLNLIPKNKDVIFLAFNKSRVEIALFSSSYVL